MLTNTYLYALQESVTTNVVHMPISKGCKYLVVVREYLSRQVEVRALTNNQSKTIVKFLYKDIIYRQSITKRLIVNRGLDFAKVVRILALTYNICQIQALAHNLQAIGKIKGGYKPIINALAKLPSYQVNNLLTVLFADQILIQSTRYLAL